MPLHLEGICKNGIAPEAVSETVEELYNTPTSSFSSINRFYHLRIHSTREDISLKIFSFRMSIEQDLAYPLLFRDNIIRFKQLDLQGQYGFIHGIYFLPIRFIQVWFRPRSP